MSQTYSLPHVEVALAPLERFEEYLQSRKMRSTRQRRVIVEEVFSGHDHFDADDLIDQLRRTRAEEKVSRSTVYRTLEDLVDAGLLRKMTLKGRTVFEHDYGYPQHDHLHCQKCDRLIEFHSDELEAIRAAVGRENKFRVTGHRFIITGICSECQNSRRPVRPLDLI
jgi:Fur family ferric uptake transcriptional regulator